MNTFWNILWLLGFGWVVAIFYGFFGLIMCATIVGMPIGLGLLQFSKFLFWPHGNAMISKSDLEVITEKERPLWWRIFAMIVRLLYFPIGLICAITGAVYGFFWLIFIITIPEGLVMMKSIGTLFNPVNKVCVPSALVDEINRTKALRRYAPRKQGQQVSQTVSINLQHTVNQSVAEAAASFCHNCGNPLGAGSRFCPKCGTQISTPEVIENGSLQSETPAALLPDSSSIPDTPETTVANNEPAQTSTLHSVSENIVVEQVYGTDTYDAEAEAERRRKNLIAIGGGVVGAILVGLFLFFILGKSGSNKKYDTNGYSVIAENLFFRSSPSAISNDNLITKLPYGTEIIVKSFDGDWAEIEYQGQEGYVGKKYILPDSQFYFIDRIWNTPSVRENVEQNRYRLALIDYITRNGLYTGDDGWQINYEGKTGTSPNSIIYRPWGSRNIPIFAFLLHNNSTGERRVVVYSFNEDDESPQFMHDEAAERDGLLRDVMIDRYGNLNIVMTGNRISPLSESESEQFDEGPGCATLEEIEAEQAAYQPQVITDGIPQSEATNEPKEPNHTVATRNEEPTIIEAEDPNKVYNNVEIAPRFPGGNAAMMKFISSNLRYPPIAAANNIQGRVVVQIVIDKTGKVSKAVVIRGKDPDLDREAVRVVTKLPDFIPGQINGRPVNTAMNIPITFKLS